MQFNTIIRKPFHSLANILNRDSFRPTKNKVITAIALLAISSALFFSSSQPLIAGLLISSTIGIADYFIKKIFDSTYSSSKPGIHQIINCWFKDQMIDIKGSWWLKINKSKKLIEFKKNWKNLTTSLKRCHAESKHLQSRCKQYFYAAHDLSGSYKTPLGTVHSVPNNFSMWMPGVAFIASYLAAKKNINGLFVCQTLEAFSTQIKEIALSDADQRSAFIVGTFQSGFYNQFPPDFKPNFPQHKATVCVEKKAGQLTIALLESMPLEGTNNKIDSAHLTNHLWNGYRQWDKFNNVELVFRAIIKACQYTNCDARLLCSQVLRQKGSGCETFALSDAISYLRDSDFFNKITCSKEVEKLSSRYQVEYMTQLPPEFMLGVQSDKLLQDYMKTIDLDQPLIQKKKTFQKYFDANKVEIKRDAKLKLQNHYITKKATNI